MYLRVEFIPMFYISKDNIQARSDLFFGSKSIITWELPVLDKIQRLHMLLEKVTLL